MMDKVKKGKPAHNIILITIDALRPDYLGCYGSSYNTSPNIDDLAKEGVLFKNAYSPLYGTDPVHTTIFTGLWLESHGIVHHGPSVTEEEIRNFLDKQNQFMPKILKSVGYRTFAIDWLGRWHKIGFDYYSGIFKSKVQKKFNSLYRKIYPMFPYNFIKRFSQSICSYESAEKVVTRTKSVIDKNYGNPFFLFLHFWDTHTPYYPPLKYIKKFWNVETKYNTEVREIINQIIDPKFRNYMKFCTYGAKYTDEVTHRYMGAINYVDVQIGELISYLKSIDLYDNSLIITMSDHGEFLGEHEIYFEHHAHFEETLKSALIMKFPEGRYVNTQVNTMVRHVDILPTILDFLGMRTNFQFDGESLLGDLSKDVKVRKTYFDLPNRVGIINGKWKYSMSLETPIKVCPRCGIIHHPPEELFNLDDQREEENLVNDQREIARKLRAKVMKYRKRGEESFQELREREKIKSKLRDLKRVGKL